MVHTIYLLRHGLRLDGEDEIYWPYYAKRKDDSPLSYYGIKQAEETAEFLQQMSIDHLFVSPFFRALQTAYPIAKKLNLQMNVEYGFMEQLTTKIFGSYPDLMTKEEALDAFSNINPDYESIVMPAFPEENSGIEVYERTGKALKAILEKFDGTILICGHGASIWETARHLIGESKAYNKKMCALHKFVCEDQQWKFMLSTTDHLTYVDSTYTDPAILNTVPAPFRKQQLFKDQFAIELGLRKAAAGHANPSVEERKGQ